ncbi:hypothetical protein OnM2_068045 [Erysiphe neolycopersici]|uniref:Uncharacterized protein n=1 Tax=Erysiphe neolycopersici TaxID=212602 RepID=A0A420HLT6_9PEZI|nr:hypothetical protein OnM2_068045 [Erysiphe neolycopersici]
MRTHFLECPEVDIQKIAYVPPPWHRCTFDFNQFRDLSDSNDTSSMSSSETRDNVTHPVNTTNPVRHFVNRPAARVSQPAESVKSSKLEGLMRLCSSQTAQRESNQTSNECPKSFHQEAFATSKFICNFSYRSIVSWTYYQAS